MASKFIASVYPIAMKAERQIYGGKFEIPAYAKGSKPVMFEVKDHVQINTLPWIFAPENAKRQSQVRVKIEAIDIARDILAEWTLRTLGQSPSCRPGMWIVRDSIAEWNEDGTPRMDAMNLQEHRPATSREYEQMFQEDMAESLNAQANWGDYCIMSGDVMGENLKAIPFIPPYMKIMCRYYGRDRKWLHNLRDGDIKKCQFCKKDIPSDAIKCMFCQEVVDRASYVAQQAIGDISEFAIPSKPEPKADVKVEAKSESKKEEETLDDDDVVIPNRVTRSHKIS